MQGDDSPPPKRRWWRWKFIFVGIALIGIAIFTATRSSVLSWYILPRLSSALGGTVQASAMHLDGIGGFSVENLELLAPDWPSESGRIAHADRVSIRFSPWKILRGEVEVRSIDIGTMTLRIAERISDPGTFNFSSLTPEGSPSSSSQRPAVTRIERLAVESGVDSDGQWELSGRIDMRGELHPSVGLSDELDLRLDGLATERAAAPFESVHGRFNLRTYAFNVEVDELKLRKESLAIAPLAAQKLLDQLDLQGSIERAAISFDGSTPPEAELRLRNMRISFPVEELGGSWAGFAHGKTLPTTGRPRIDLREGVLKLTKDSLTLEDLLGDFSASNPSQPVLSVPVQASASIQIPTDELLPFAWKDREAWFQTALTAAKIDAQVSVRNFSSPPDGDARVLYLPKAVTDAFQDFGLTKWTVDIEAEAHRAAGTTTKPGAVVSTGEIRLTDASGAYSKFPYPVDQVSALMRLEGDTVKIVRFNGRGSENAQIEISGTLTSLATGAEIEIAIKGTDAPLDSRLLNAFDDEAKVALEQLFDQSAVASLSEANLLPDAAALARQSEIVARHSADPPTAPLPLAEIERLKRSIEAGPFKLGGSADLDIRVYSPPGFNTEVQTTGTVSVHAAGLACSPFPYPLRIESGIITVLDESIVLSGGGLQGVTPVGGRVTVAGSVEILRTDGDSREVIPKITLTAEDDSVNLALLAAIPHDTASSAKPPTGWPGKNFSPSGALLRALGLSGTYSATGTIGGHASSDFTFEVQLTDGRVEPTESGSDWLATQQLDWPPDFTLDGVKARLDINSQQLRLTECTAQRGNGRIDVTATASLTGTDSELEVRFERIPLDRAFEPLLDADAAKAAALWQRYLPNGEIDGSFHRKVTADVTSFEGTILPQWIEVTLDGDRVRASLVTGRIDASGDNNSAQDLGFRLTTGARQDGLLRLRGALDAHSLLEATLTDGRFESPVVRAALRDQSPALADLLASGKTTGLFDLTATRDQSLSLQLQPKSLAFDHHDTRSTLTFSPTSKVQLAEQQAHGVCAASFAGGNVSVDWSADLTGNALRSLQLTGDIAADSYSPTVAALLTPSVEAITNSLTFHAKGASTIHADEVKLSWNLGSPVTAPDALDVRAHASVKGASFDVGPQLADFEGSADLTVRQRRGAVTEDSLHCEIDANSFTSFGRSVGKSRGVVSRASAKDDLIVSANGDFLGGRWATDATIEHDANRWRAHTRVANSNYGPIVSPGFESVRSDQSGRGAASISLSGLLDDGVGTDIGRGGIAVREAVIAESPLLLRIASLTQFMIPVSGAFKEADADFAIKGDLAYFEPVELRSASLRMDGLGTVRLSDYAVAMQLRVAGQMGVVSEFLSRVTHSLLGIRVSGTITDPKIGLAPLAGVLSAVSGGATSSSVFPLPPPASPVQPAAPSAPTPPPAANEPNSP